MYCILIKDENGYYSTYNIGDEIKLYSSEENAQKDVDDMLKKEKELFGDILTSYQVVPYEE